MNPNSRQGFVLSILLHVAVAAALVLFTFIKPPEKETPTIFELVSMPAPAAEASEAESAVEFNVPQVRPPPPRPRPPVIQEPPPVPPPVVPVAKPEPRKPPEPKPPEKVAPPISYEDFVRQHGAPTAPTQRRPVARPVTVPKINTTFTANIRETVIDFERLGQLSDAEQSALDRWIARLKEALRRAWDKPVSLAESLSTTVEFEVALNGRISGVRVTQSSGNSGYDQTVTGAFSTLGNAGTPPDGRAQRLRLTFRMTDQ